MGKVVPLTAACLLLCIKRIHIRFGTNTCNTGIHWQSIYAAMLHAILEPSSTKCPFFVSLSLASYNCARNFSCVICVFYGFFFLILMLFELQFHYTWMREMFRIRPAALMIEGSSASICGKQCILHANIRRQLFHSI